MQNLSINELRNSNISGGNGVCKCLRKDRIQDGQGEKHSEALSMAMGTVDNCKHFCCHQNGAISSLYVFYSGNVEPYLNGEAEKRLPPMAMKGLLRGVLQGEVAMDGPHLCGF